MTFQEQLVKYSEYNIWANTKFIDILKSMDESDLDHEQVSSFSSLRKTFYHIWDAQSIWYMRLSGESLAGFPSKDFKGTTEEALELFHQSSVALSDYIKTISDESLNQSLDYKNLKGEPFTSDLHDILHHVLNHSTFHRGQLVTMLRNVGITTIPSTDFITYCRL